MQIYENVGPQKEI